VLAITGSPAQAGLIGALRALMYIVLILPAGALLDRWKRKQRYRKKPSCVEATL
jgi:MFS family permease